MMPMDKNKEDVMSAHEIADELEKLLESEKAEGENDPSQLKNLQSALDMVREFADEESNEPDAKAAAGDKPMDDDEKPSNAVDTSLLTGPIGGLKSFLVKKAQDNSAQY